MNHGDEMEPSRAADEVIRILRAHHSGTVRAGGSHVTRRYVTDPATCRPVVALPTELAEDYDGMVLSVPDDSTPELELLVVPKMIDRRTHAAADRLLIYHREVEDRALYLLDIETARCHAGMVSGDEVPSPDPLHDVEAEICLELNSDPRRVAKVCFAANGVTPSEPMLVGVDRFGLDVRARFGVVRVEFAAPVCDEASLRAAIEGLESRG